MAAIFAPVQSSVCLTDEEQERLNSLGLFYNPCPQPALICVGCGFVLSAHHDRVSRHVGERHGVPKALRKGLNELIRRLAVPEPQQLQPMPNGSLVHPKLELQSGFACRHCRLPSSSLKVLDGHVRRDHADQAGASTGGELNKQAWCRQHIEVGVYFQSWGRRDVSRAWTVRLSDGISRTPSGSLSPIVPTSGPVHDFVAILEQDERRRIGQGTQQGNRTAHEAEHPNMISSWMRRTGWAPTFALARRNMLVTLTGLPRQLGPQHWQHQHIRSDDDCVKIAIAAADEAKVALIVSAVDAVMDRCADTMRHSDVSVRRWLRSTQSSRPHRRPMELVAHATSERRYRSELKRFICLWLRLALLSPALLKTVSGRPLYTSQREALKALWLHPVWKAGETEPPHEPIQASSRAPGAGNRGDMSNSDNMTCLDSSLDDDSASDSDDDHGHDYESDSLYDEEDGEEGKEDALTSDADNEYEEDNECTVAYQQEDSQMTLKSTEALPEGIKSNAAVDVLLRFLIHAISEDFVDGNPRSTLLVFYAAVRGLNRPSGEGFLHPHQYTGVLAALTYCLRLLSLEACLPRFPHQHIGLSRRPMRGHLKRLRRFHSERMCDGTMSPLGELTNLLCFGFSLRRTATPSFWFEWSDDGQTISWDGTKSVTMAQFRNLVSKALSSAQERCLDLLYDWEPPLPDFGTLADRLSCSRLGYSFVTNEANGIHDAYLQLLQRVCASPDRGLVHVAGDKAGAFWNRRAVMAYLDAHDCFIQALLTVMQVAGGKPARVTELLTLELTNSASRLRGIGIHRGRLFSLVRHHKARQRTNNEFHVARFYPRPVEHLLYRYLVYIRPCVDVLVRQCLPSRGELGHLLFSTASLQRSLDAGTTTLDLRRLSSYVPLSPATTAGMGTRSYRQLVTAIAEMHVKPAIEPFNRHQDKGTKASPSAVLAWQAGHRPLQQATTYGLDGAYPLTLQPALLDLYATTSCLWHRFIGLAKMLDASPSRNDQAVSSTPTSQNKRPMSQLYYEVEQPPTSLPKRPHYTSTESLYLVSSTTLHAPTESEAPPADISHSIAKDRVTRVPPSEASPPGEQSLSPSPYVSATALDGFIYDKQHGVAVCKICKTCLSSHLKAQVGHLRRDPHGLRGQQLKAITIALGSWSLKTKHQLRKDKPLITEPCKPIKGLALYPGFVCYCVAVRVGNAEDQRAACGFCTRRWVRMQEHLSSAHGIKGSSSNDELGRWRACMLQTYYTAGGLIDYFVVEEKGEAKPAEAGQGYLE